MRLVIFDADGTLIDSQAAIHESMRRTFIMHGHDELPIDATRSIIGLTLDQAIAKLLGQPVDTDILAMGQTYKEISFKLQKDPAMHSMLYEGIANLIECLSNQRETLIAIATGKSARGLNAMIDAHDLREKLVAWRSADDCPSKPHPAMILEICDIAGCTPQQSVMVGDSSYDMEMAVNAGSRALGVSWGYQSVETLLRTGATVIADKPDELLQAIDQIFEG